MMMRSRASRVTLVGLLVVVGVGLGAWAQSVSLNVTAYSDAVRFSAQGAVKELRVEILALSGQKVFDSGPVLGNALDWKLLNSQGQPVANGVYLYAVTVRDPSGNVTKKIGKLAVLRGKGVAAPPLSGITVGQLAEPRLQPLAQTINDDLIVTGRLTVGSATLNTNFRLFVMDDTDSAAAQTVFGVSRSPTGSANQNTFFQLDNFFTPGPTTPAGSHARLTFARGTRASPLAVQSGDRIGSFLFSAYTGTQYVNPVMVGAYIDGAVSSNAAPGRLTFETGECFVTDGCANPRTERMVIKSDGNIGIGTSSPSAKTHINNTANQPALRIDSSAGTNALEIYNTEGGQNLIFRVERATGNVYADGSFTGGGADVAERIDVTEAVEPGDVVEIDPDNPGKFRKAREALSTRVAGVISTAPGVVLGNKSAEHNDARPILALAGRVPVKATAKYGAIAVGDLLVSSPIPGYAMKCPEKSQCIGAVIGKALEPLAEGSGLIEVQIVLR
jgi:hypothetical protein